MEKILSLVLTLFNSVYLHAGETRYSDSCSLAYDELGITTCFEDERDLRSYFDKGLALEFIHTPKPNLPYPKYYNILFNIKYKDKYVNFDMYEGEATPLRIKMVHNADNKLVILHAYDLFSTYYKTHDIDKNWIVEADGYMYDAFIYRIFNGFPLK